MTRVALLLIASAVWAGGADSPLDSMLRAVEGRYNRAQTLQVTFSETYTGPQRPRKTESGRLYLRKPGRMRWEYTQPAGKLFVSDGKWLYLYTPGAEQAEKIMVKESDDMRAPLAFLLGKLDFDRDFRNFQSRQEGADTVIAAEPKADNLPYTHVEFAVTPDFRLRRVQVTGFDKSVLDYSFESETRNPALDARLFRFQPPAGVAIVETSQ
jgi:outer membrane lipoprotein carrier protein